MWNRIGGQYTAADDASRKFTVKAGCDRDGNNTLDPEEVTREIEVVLLKVDLAIPLYMGTEQQEVPGTLTLAGGNTPGKWLIVYTTELMKIFVDGKEVKSGELSSEVTLPQTISLAITTFTAAGNATVVASFIP